MQMIYTDLVDFCRIFIYLFIFILALLLRAGGGNQNSAEYDKTVSTF